MNSFTEQVLLEISNRKNNISDLLRQLNTAKPSVVWGTGVAGDMVYHALNKMGITPDNYADNNSSKWGTDFHGSIVLKLADIPKNATVLIAANHKYGIDIQLSKEGVNNSFYIDPVLLYFYEEGQQEKLINLYKENKNQINDVARLLADDESAKVFHNILVHRAIHDLDLIRCIYDENQYFGNDLIPIARGAFVDCGAYCGDTLSYFLAQVGDNSFTYYALEADKKNFEMLSLMATDTPNRRVVTLNTAVWDRAETLHFKKEENAGDVAGTICQGGEEEIQADSLDCVLNGKRIDFIKMDIEGAELHALDGAKSVIKQNRPILAISAYHVDNHLWEVPLKIQSIESSYKLYFRHHMWNAADTVCYGL